MGLTQGSLPRRLLSPLVALSLSACAAPSDLSAPAIAEEDGDYQGPPSGLDPDAEGIPPEALAPPEIEEEGQWYSRWFKTRAGGWRKLTYTIYKGKRLLEGDIVLGPAYT